jgi:hypothetical protein
MRILCSSEYCLSICQLHNLVGRRNAYRIDESCRIASLQMSAGRAIAQEQGNWAKHQDHLPCVFVSDHQPEPGLKAGTRLTL